MASLYDAKTVTKITPNDGDSTYFQPLDELASLDTALEVAVAGVVQNRGGTDTVTISLETSNIKNTDTFTTIAQVAELTGAMPAADFPAPFFAYLGGASGASATPGFGRYLRIKVDFDNPSDFVTFSMNMLLKP